MIGLGEFARRLAALDLDAVQREALAQARERLADAVRARLATPPGGPHTAPWMRNGALYDSIAGESDARRVVVGSTSAVARYQELGTRFDPPRPFLAPAAAALAPEIAADIAARLAQAIAELP